MTALTDNYLRDSKDPRILSAKVKGSTTIYKGAMVAIDSSGYAVPAANTAGHKFIGIALEKIDNSAGANGEKEIRVNAKDRFIIILASAAITDIGLDVFVADDNTVTKTVGNAVKVGKVVALVGTNLVEVDPIPAYASAPAGAHLADVTETFTSHAWNGSTYPTQAEGDKIVADIAALSSAIAALNARLESIGVNRTS